MTRLLRRMPAMSKTRAVLAATVMAVLLAACVFAPGRFTSQFNLRKDRTFSFRYTGEILMIPLMQTNKDTPFTPEPCRDEQTYEEHPCSAAELAEQKANWEKQRAESRKTDAQAAQMFLGGIDPNNPESGKELAAKIRRQAGWNKVEYLGDGKFDVDFAMSGKLDHDFIFPTFEGFPMSNAFVQVYVRRDGTVRIDAPSFGPQTGAAALGSGMASGLKMSGSDDEDTRSLADGTFTLVTNAEILANNTDEGPKTASGGKALVWKVNPRTAAAPTALIKLAP